MVAGWGNGKQGKRPGNVPTILCVDSPFVRGICTFGGSQYSCRSGPKETVNGRRGCLVYTVPLLQEEYDYKTMQATKNPKI